MASNQQEFAGHVDDFFRVDDKHRGASEEMRGLRTNKSDLESRIARHMHENGIPETVSPSGSLKIYTGKTRVPMNKALVEEAAAELFGDDQAARLLKLIDSKRAVVEKLKLKRTINIK
ncbi:unnamed protein product [Pylaiella littoralis]